MVWKPASPKISARWSTSGTIGRSCAPGATRARTPTGCRRGRASGGRSGFGRRGDRRKRGPGSRRRARLHAMGADGCELDPRARRPKELAELRARDRDRSLCANHLRLDDPRRNPALKHLDSLERALNEAAEPGAGGPQAEAHLPPVVRVVQGVVVGVRAPHEPRLRRDLEDVLDALGLATGTGEEEG